MVLPKGDDKLEKRSIKDLEPHEKIGLARSFEEMPERSLVDTADIYGIHIKDLIHFAVEYILRERWHAFSERRRNSTTDGTTG